MPPYTEGSYVYRFWTWRDSPVHLRDILAGGTSGRFGCSGLSVSAFSVLPAGKDCSCSRFLSWRVAEGLADSAVRFLLHVQRIHSLDDLPSPNPEQVESFKEEAEEEVQLKLDI